MKKILSIAVMTLGLLGVASCGSKAEAGQATAEAEAAAVGMESAAGDQVVSTQVMDNPVFKVKDNMIISENLPVVVDFFATWCGPCKQYAPVFHEVAAKYQGTVCFVSIDVDEYPDIAKAYGVTSIPTTAFISTGGDLMGTQTGVIPAETLDSYINQLVATTAGEDEGI